MFTGNTSDIQEAISEGASSHSVGSQDLENDDDNDNFSDMISANVSGRGTPNISGSGRETPLSQAESMEQEPAPHPQPALPETVQKKNREDVTDKFGKFEIKQELDCKFTFSQVKLHMYTICCHHLKPGYVKYSVKSIDVQVPMLLLGKTGL